MKKISIKTPERNVLAACLDLLFALGVFHHRNNSGALKTQKGHFVRFGTVGSPDIVCVINGKYCGVEVKGTAGTLSAAQIAFQNALEAAGGVYWLIRSADELERKIRGKRTIEGLRTRNI